MAPLGRLRTVPVRPSARVVGITEAPPLRTQPVPTKLASVWPDTRLYQLLSPQERNGCETGRMEQPTVVVVAADALAGAADSAARTIPRLSRRRAKRSRFIRTHLPWCVLATELSHSL